MNSYKNFDIPRLHERNSALLYAFTTFLIFNSVFHFYCKYILLYLPGFEVNIYKKLDFPDAEKNHEKKYFKAKYHKQF